MNENSIGTPVRALQTMLRQIALLDATIPSVIPDGIYGRDTRAAVAAFQRAEGLPVTGVTDLTTWEAIRGRARLAQRELAPAEPLILRLDRGQSFAPDEENILLFPIQGALAGICAQYANAPALALTGVYDASTRDAVCFLQRHADLPETGLLDRQTWRVISRLFSLVCGRARTG